MAEKENLWDNEYEDNSADPLDDIDDLPDDKVEDTKTDIDDIDDAEPDDEYFMDDDDRSPLGPDDGEPDTKDSQSDEPDVEPDVELTEEDKQAAKAAEQVLKIVGEDTILKVKGREYRAGDLSDKELTAFLQKGIRSEQLFDEAAQQRQELDQQRQVLARGQDAVNQLLNRQRDGQQDPGAEVPEHLKASEFDSPEVKALKGTVSSLVQEMGTLKSTSTESQVQNQQAIIETEMRELEKQHPMGSVDEAIAVKYFRPDLDLSELMEKSHEHYTSKDFILNAMDHNPTAKREIEEGIIKRYNASKNRATKVPTRSFRGGSSDRVSSKPRKVSRDFDSADDLAAEYVREIEEMNRS